MGASRIEIIADTMMSYGLDSDTPVAVIENEALNVPFTELSEGFEVIDGAAQPVITVKLALLLF